MQENTAFQKRQNLVFHLHINDLFFCIIIDIYRWNDS